MLTTRHRPDRTGHARSLEVDLPAYWSSYLINGDASGLDADELEEARQVVDYLAFSGYRIVDVARNYDPETDCYDAADPFCGRYDGLLTEMLHYVCDHHPELDQS